MVDLHRHDEYSTFDGFGKAKELAKLAKELGYTSLGLSNHNNTNGLIQHYYECNEAEIKPIMGVECSFEPVFSREKRGYHLCLFIKNLVGYGNMNKILWEAEQHKYYNPIVTFRDLKGNTEGLICTSACITSSISQAILNKNYDTARKLVKEFVKIFGEDFYMEIQPYSISRGLDDKERRQENVNVWQIKIAKEFGVKCILTSDSHYGTPEDFDTYMKMHEIAKHKYDIQATYGERYMPELMDMPKRFYKMHQKDFGKEKAKSMALEMMDNLQEIEDKVEDMILDKLEIVLPQLFEGHDSYELLETNVKKGLKEKKLWKEEYWVRCKEELDVIKHHGFSDYFLIVQDYTLWAKEQGIFVGPGRGSVCNSEVAYALGITTVDSLRFNLEFRRFLRMDKNKMPDIDLDFETSRRHEVIEYMIKKYPGHASQICSYGLYKVDNLINDLAKVSGLNMTDKDNSDEEKKGMKSEIAAIKKFIREFESENGIDFPTMLESTGYKSYNKQYDNILVHFHKLYQKIRFIGTHAAGVAITGGQLLDYTGLRLDKEGRVFANYDLADLDRINVVKFDFLGLKTVESIGELRLLTGRDNYFDISDYLDDVEVNEAFGRADTDGVFQFASRTAKQILLDIKSDNFEDITAASAMNRPGPLSLGMPKTYAANKFDSDNSMLSQYWEYTKDTYGTIVYQEQLMMICINIGKMTWAEADKVMKVQKRSGQNAAALTGANSKALEAKDGLIESFTKGAMENGYSYEEAYDFFQSLLVYTFNRGHAVAYTLLSFEEMFYKVHHPTEFWYSKVKYSKDDEELRRFCEKAVVDDVVVFLPHVNLSVVKTSLRKEDGERVIQQGLTNVNGVGEKAAVQIIEERRKNGIFKSYDDFYDRCKSRIVTVRVIAVLKECGAIEINKSKFIKRVVLYNSALYLRGLK